MGACLSTSDSFEIRIQKVALVAGVLWRSYRSKFDFSFKRYGEMSAASLLTTKFRNTNVELKSIELFLNCVEQLCNVFKCSPEGRVDETLGGHSGVMTQGRLSPPPPRVGSKLQIQKYKYKYKYKYTNTNTHADFRLVFQGRGALTVLTKSGAKQAGLQLNPQTICISCNHSSAALHSIATFKNSV